MKTAVMTVLASLGALALCHCSSSSPSADGGTGNDSGTPQDAGGYTQDSGGNPTDAGPGWDGGQSFPATSIIYQDVSDAGLDPNSQGIIWTLADGGGWGGSGFQLDFSMVILHADATVVPTAFTPNAGYYTPDCDMTKVPIPSGGAVEGNPNYDCTGDGDCHMLVYQGQRLYELYHADMSTGVLTSDCEVAWDLTHDYWVSGATPYSRGDQCTSTDAAGMPVAPLLVTGAELEAGVVNHALRFILPNARIRAGYYLHPGTHAANTQGSSGMPYYVSRFRLRGDFDITGLSPGAQVIATALKKYGMFLDDGGNITVTVDASAQGYVGSQDLFSLQVTDFEVVASPDAPVTLTFNCQRTPLTQ
jgi:hypothetical protein